jgi:hypothetical protein
VSQQDIILAYNHISRMMITNGVLAEYTELRMLLEALPRDLGANAVLKPELDPPNPSTFE